MANTPVTLISENDSAMCSVINGSGTYGKRAWLSASPERLGEVTTQCVGQLDAPLIVRFVNGTEIAPRAVKSGVSTAAVWSALSFPPVAAGCALASASRSCASST